MSANPFPDRLRAEYDPELLDVPGRRAKAQQLQTALQRTGLWNDPRRILDVGCGSGLTLAALDAAESLRVGCDIRSDPYRQGAALGCIEFAAADCAQLPLASEAFDLVICLAVIGEFPNPHRALNEMARCVAPGGCLYVTVANSPMLLRRYALQEKLGYPTRASWKSYARACLPLFQNAPERGWGICALKCWEFTDVTSALAQSVSPRLDALPPPLLQRLLTLAAPSFAFAWRRPF